MAYKPQNVQTGQPTGTHTPVNSPNLTGPQTEGCSSRQLLLLFLPHPESETRLVVVLPGALQQIPPHETIISMNPRRIGCPSSSSYPVSGPCFFSSSSSFSLVFLHSEMYSLRVALSASFCFASSSAMTVLLVDSYSTQPR